MLKRYFWLLGMSCLSLSVWASPEGVIRESLKKIAPEMPIEEVSATPIKGLYQVVSGANILYVTDNGQYILEGELFEVDKEKGTEVVNLTNERRQLVVEKVINNIDPRSLIVFPAKNEKTYITVFTDIDCGYCRALHKEVPALNAAGITVRYIAFPRTPAGSESFKKAEYVWCAKDRQTALTLAKEGKDPKPVECKNPVAQQQDIGKSLGFNVTPVIVFKNGYVLPGYLPAAQLIKAAQLES